MEFDGVYQIMVFFVMFCKLEVPKMWENSPVLFSPVLQFSVICFFNSPHLKLKANNPCFHCWR
jgi:hypothetical protein